eukprot:jgi/Astpho2/2570/fgenesh1_pg.00048_%23_70_t
MGGEKKLVRRVADLMQADRNMQLLDAVEKVMDEVDYDDTMTVDEVADLVEKERQHRKEVAKDADYQEKMQLKEAQKKMDRLAMQSQKQDTEKEDEDEWEPEFEAPKSSEWDNTLEVLDKLQDRLKAATNKHDGKEGPAPVDTTGDNSQPC